MRFNSIRVHLHLVLAVYLMALCQVVLASENPQEIAVNGATLDYIVDGAGPPVVLVHGHISDHRVWEESLPKLSDEYQVFAYTQRYYGNKVWLDDAKHFGRNTHITDLISFVEGLSVGPVHLVTRSYGGYVGIHAISRRPELFKSAVHFEPAIADHITSNPGYDHAWREIIKGMGPVTNALKKGEQDSAALRFLEVVYRMPVNSADETLKAKMLEMIRENGRTVGPFFNMDPIEKLDCQALAGINTPQMIVQGETTHVWFAMASEGLDQCLADSRIFTMKQVNHDGIARDPEHFANLVKEFFR